jgi:hypothetical protein
MYVTPENYHSQEVKREYMSNSQWKHWLKCPMATVAELEGRFVRETSEALLVGSYVDRALTMPQEFDAWCELHKEDIFKTKSVKGIREYTGEKYAPFVNADIMIARMKADPFYPVISENSIGQAVFEGEIDGMKWLYMADWLIEGSEPVIFDLKTAKGFEDDWAEDEYYSGDECKKINKRVPWYDAAGYWRQLAIGRELYRQKTGLTAACGIVAVTKQDPPALGLWALDDVYRLDREISHIKKMTYIVKAWKDGSIPAPKCGVCEWCRSLSALEPQRIGISKRVYSVE